MGTAGPIAGRCFGLETEYGIVVESQRTEDLMEEARLLVTVCPGPTAGPWDYRAEDPRRDMRGFQVQHLNYDRQDAELDTRSGRQYSSVEEQRADRILPNGARLYNDHGHPEYATPECCSLRELVAQDRAGERLVLECARRRTAETGREVRLFKNNTDYHGASYGCHEGYLCARSIPFEALLCGLLPFLVTRSLFAGAGKVGIESGAGLQSGPYAVNCRYQLSQRADFFSEVASVDTLAKRPVFNTRDEPHADPERYRRLHVICGDANLSEWATAMKVGATCLVLGLIEAGWEPLFRLQNPVAAFQSVSRDPERRGPVTLEDGRTMRASDIQRIYHRDARQLLAGACPETDWVLAEWARVLDDLDQDPYRAADRVDWAAKLQLLEMYQEAEGTDWDETLLRSLELEYHQVDPEVGLYYAIEEQMVRLVEEADVLRAGAEPPADTRAAIRGELVRRFPDRIERGGWGRVALRGAPGMAARWVTLPVDPAEAACLLGRLRETEGLEAFLHSLP
ncbi:MAG: peptidase [Armatimonadetes bacterium]|nr:peptidase [Armatimonadota bacterium]